MTTELSVPGDALCVPKLHHHHHHHHHLGVGLRGALEGPPAPQTRGALPESFGLACGTTPTCNHSVILNLSFLGLDQEIATKWPYNWSSGLISCAFCTICRAWPVGAGLGGQVWPESG